MVQATQADIDRINKMIIELEGYQESFFKAKTSASRRYYEKKGKALMVRIHSLAEYFGLPCPFEDCASSSHSSVEVQPVSDFLELYDDVVPLTDELYQSLIDSGKFQHLTKNDFDYMRANGFVFNKARQSFVMLGGFDDDFHDDFSFHNLK